MPRFHATHNLSPYLNHHILSWFPVAINLINVDMGMSECDGEMHSHAFSRHIQAICQPPWLILDLLLLRFLPPLLSFPLWSQTSLHTVPDAIDLDGEDKFRCTLVYSAPIYFHILSHPLNIRTSHPSSRPRAEYLPTGVNVVFRITKMGCQWLPAY